MTAVPYGVVQVGELQIAIPAAALEQVVLWPERIISHPSSQPWLLGLFELRAKALPLIDMHSLLGVNVSLDRPRCVAIIRHQGGRLGLSLDAVVDVLSLDIQQIDELRGMPGALLPRIHLQAGGERLVHLLDLQALVDQPEVILANNEGPPVPASKAITATDEKLYLLFECDGRRLCLDALIIQELVDSPELIASQFASDFCQSVTQVRGHDLPVLELSALLGLPFDKKQERGQMLVLSAGPQQEYRVAFGFDRLLGMWRCNPAHCSAMPTFSLQRAHMFTGLFANADGEPGLLIDHQALSSCDEVLSYARIYRTEQAAKLAQRHTQRQPCLVFRAARSFAAPLGQIIEVLPFPRSYISLQHGESRLLGLMDVRGRQISLICLTTLAGGLPISPESRQVVIVEGARQSFGLVVERIDVIDSFTDLPTDALARAWLPDKSGAVNQALSWVSIGPVGNRRQVTLIDLKELVVRLEE